MGEVTTAMVSVGNKVWSCGKDANIKVWDAQVHLSSTFYLFSPISFHAVLLIYICLFVYLFVYFQTKMCHHTIITGLATNINQMLVSGEFVWCACDSLVVYHTEVSPSSSSSSSSSLSLYILMNNRHMNQW